MCLLDPDNELAAAGGTVCYNIRCRYHLIGQHDGGRIALFHPAAAAVTQHKPLAMWSNDDVARACEALPESCSLDVANQGPQTYDRVGEVMGMTGEAVRDNETTYLRRNRMVFRRMVREAVSQVEQQKQAVFGFLTEGTVYEF